MAAAHARGNPIPQPGSSGGSAIGRDGSVAQQRLQGVFLTIIGLAGAFGGVLFAIEAPRFTPVPVVFLTFWLVMVIVGQILFAGLRKLRAAGVDAPAPGQVRAAAAVAAIVVAVGLTGLATTTGTGSAVAAPCPGGGPATCGPTPGPGPELTFTPPAQQTAPGQQGQQGAQQDNNGIATSPAGSGGNNDGGNIQAQTPDFGTPGEPAPNIPGNPTGQAPGQQQPGRQGQQRGPVQTTAPGQPQQTSQQQPGQTGQASPSQPTVTVTQTQSQCPAPGAAGGANGGAPGGGSDSGSGGGGGPDSGGGDDGAPSWAYLVGEASALLTGRRRPGIGGGAAQQPATRSFDQIIDPTTSSDSGGGGVGGGPREVAFDDGGAPAPDDTSSEEPSTSTESGDGGSNDGGGETPLATRPGELIDKADRDSVQYFTSGEETVTPGQALAAGRSLEENLAIIRGTPLLNQVGPYNYTPQQLADQAAAAKAAAEERAATPILGPIAEASQPPAPTPPLATPPEQIVPNPKWAKPPESKPAQSAQDVVAPILAQASQPPVPDPALTALYTPTLSDGPNGSVIETSWDEGRSITRIFPSNADRKTGAPVATNTRGPDGKTMSYLQFPDSNSAIALQTSDQDGNIYRVFRDGTAELVIGDKGLSQGDFQFLPGDRVDFAPDGKQTPTLNREGFTGQRSQLDALQKATAAIAQTYGTIPTPQTRGAAATAQAISEAAEKLKPGPSNVPGPTDPAALQQALGPGWWGIAPESGNFPTAGAFEEWATGVPKKYAYRLPQPGQKANGQRREDIKFDGFKQIPGLGNVLIDAKYENPATKPWYTDPTKPWVPVGVREQAGRQVDALKLADPTGATKIFWVTSDQATQNSLKGILEEGDPKVAQAIRVVTADQWHQIAKTPTPWKTP